MEIISPFNPNDLSPQPAQLNDTLELKPLKAAVNHQVNLENTKKNTHELRQSIVEQLEDKTHRTYLARSKSVWSLLIGNNPGLKDKIDQFTNTHPEKIDLIKANSWKTLKNNLQLKMAHPMKEHSDKLSMEQFRDEANTLIRNLVADAIKDLGLPEVGWTACGTAGYNSDVDTAMFKKNGGMLSLEEAYTIEFIRNATHTYIFGGLSGSQLDTECYTPHPAANETAKHLTLEEFKQKFTTSEYAMGLLQAKVSLQNDPSTWKVFSKQELDSIDDPERKTSTEIMINNIEQWHKDMDLDIRRAMIEETPSAELLNMANAKSISLRQLIESMPEQEIREEAGKIVMQDPESYKRAALNYRTPIMLKLAASCNQLENELSSTQNQLYKLKELSVKDPQIESLIYRSEKLMIEKDIIEKMLNSLQDEGTFSQSEGNVTLFREGGQIDLGNKAKSSKTLKLEADSMKTQITMNRIPANTGTAPLREQVKSNRPKRLPPAPQELTLAAYEEQQQFYHVMHEGLKHAFHQNDPVKGNEEAFKTAVSAGKYCLRTTKNKLRAMELVEIQYQKEGKLLPPEFFTLRNSLKVAAHKAHQLEHCKRKFALSAETALPLLTEMILSKALHRGVVLDKQRTTDDLASMINQLNPGGELTEETLLKREKMNMFVNRLLELGYIDEIIIEQPERASLLGEKRLPKDRWIRLVLQATIGYSRVKEHHGDLDRIFQKADKLTRQNLQLITRDDIKKFGEHIEQLSQSWQNMSYSMGVVGPFAEDAWIAEALNFNRIWNTAKAPPASKLIVVACKSVFLLQSPSAILAESLVYIDKKIQT